MESHSTRESSRSYVMRAAEGRKEIVEYVSVRQIDDLQSDAPLEAIAMK